MSVQPFFSEIAGYARAKINSRGKSNKEVLFGGVDKNADKKEIIWKMVSEAEPQIIWLYSKNNTLKKENFDQADAYTCVRGYMKMNGLW